VQLLEHKLELKEEDVRDLQLGMELLRGRLFNAEKE
jgi:hypothetical protein